MGKRAMAALTRWGMCLAIHSLCSVAFISSIVCPQFRNGVRVYGARATLGTEP